MKKLLYIFPVFALLIASCENYYMDHQLGFENTIDDVRNFTYTLTDADYKAIANNAKNIEMALALDPVDSSFYATLQKVGSNKYFSDSIISADVYIPAFLSGLYPQLSKGTICEVFFNVLADQPLYFTDFAIMREFTPSTEIPTIDDIPAVMASEITNKRDGWKFWVYYRDDMALLYQYTKETDTFSPYENDQVEVYVLCHNDYLELGSVKGVASPETTLPIFLKEHYPYAAAESKKLVCYKNESGVRTFTEFHYDGNAWVALSTTAEESMSFEMKDTWKANTSVFLTEPFIGHGQGAFVIQNVLLQDPLTYVWYYSATYGMCASAYKGGASYDSEAWLVSPRVKLKKAKKPALIFDQAFNKAANFTEECTVLVSTDYKGDVTTATWEALEWNKNDDGTLNVPNGTTWIFQTTGDLDMSKWAGQNVYIGFRYTTSKGISGTWELQNVLVHETAVEE